MRRWSLVCLLSIGLAFAYTHRTNISFATATPEFVAYFRLSDPDRGLLNSAFFWTYGLLQIPAGFLVDRFGPKWPLSAGVLLWCLFSAACGLANGLWALLGLRMLLGLGEAVITPAGLRWIRDHIEEPRRGTATGIFEGSAYFPYVAPQAELSADLELRFQRRGQYSENSFGLATRFPFAFLTKTRRVPLNRTVLVYPAVEPTDEFLDALPMITGEVASFVRGRGYDLYRIREYMPEDSARHVDWKATAKSGSLKVREFSREDERKLRLVLDNPAPGMLAPDAYERAIALAASLAWHFANEDADMSFVAQGYKGEADVYKFLSYLALVEPVAGDSLIDKLPVTGDYNIVLTCRARGSVPTGLWNRSYMIFLGEDISSQRSQKTRVPEKLLRTRS